MNPHLIKQTKPFNSAHTCLAMMFDVGIPTAYDHWLGHDGSEPTVSTLVPTAAMSEMVEAIQRIYGFAPISHTTEEAMIAVSELLGLKPPENGIYNNCKELASIIASNKDMYFLILTRCPSDQKPAQFRWVLVHDNQIYDPQCEYYGNPEILPIVGVVAARGKTIDNAIAGVV